MILRKILIEFFACVIEGEVFSVKTEYWFWIFVGLHLLFFTFITMQFLKRNKSVIPLKGS